MQRCLDLALLGLGSVAPNPLVGAVLVYNDRIIGEGFHEKFGAGHAEVNCLKAVSGADQVLIKSAVLYVSLEPCAHFGKTPPCAQLIIEHQIPKVVIACRDPFEKVNGKGIEMLRAAGIEVELGILEKDAITLNKRFFVFHEQKRPYLILKWAETADQTIDSLSGERLMITNEFSNRLVHRWRSEEAAILVGTNTAVKDNPSLTNRLWKGKNPVRLVIDKTLRLNKSLQLFNTDALTVVFNERFHDKEANIIYYKLDFSKDLIEQILNACYELQIQSVIVEGGSILLQSFINKGLWDEARVIRNGSLYLKEGVAAPELKNQVLVEATQLASDTIFFYKNISQKS